MSASCGSLLVTGSNSVMVRRLCLFRWFSRVLLRRKLLAATLSGSDEQRYLCREAHVQARLAKPVVYT